MKMYSQEIEKKLKYKSNKIKVCQYIKDETEKQNTNIVKPHFAYFLQNYILKTHWDIVRKVGCGIDRILITLNFYGPGKCFAIYRKDHTFAMISWRECLNNKYK